MDDSRSLGKTLRGFLLLLFVFCFLCAYIFWGHIELLKIKDKSKAPSTSLPLLSGTKCIIKASICKKV